ncbi:13278_t:CDS:2, partial [Ambispora leptoticha]
MVFKPVLASTTSFSTSSCVSSTPSNNTTSATAMTTCLNPSPNILSASLSTSAHSSLTPLTPSIMQPPSTVNVTTQKDQKNQKCDDGNVKKITTPRKKRNTASSKSSTATKKSKPSAKQTKSSTSSRKDKEASNQAEIQDSAIQPETNASSSEILSGTQQLQNSETITTVSTPSKNSRKRKNVATTVTKITTTEAGGSQATMPNSKSEEAAEESKKPAAKRQKKTKDPNAPKRPLNAFIEFSRVKREEVKRDNPDMKYTEIRKRLGEMWRGLSETEKEPYKNVQQAAKERYAQEIKIYEANQAATAATRTEISESSNMTTINNNNSIMPTLPTKLDINHFLPTPEKSLLNEYNKPNNICNPVIPIIADPCDMTAMDCAVDNINNSTIVNDTMSIMESNAFTPDGIKEFPLQNQYSQKKKSKAEIENYLFGSSSTSLKYNYNADYNHDNKILQQNHHTILPNPSILYPHPQSLFLVQHPCATPERLQQHQPQQQQQQQAHYMNFPHQQQMATTAPQVMMNAQKITPLQQINPQQPEHGNMLFHQQQQQRQPMMTIAPTPHQYYNDNSN